MLSKMIPNPVILNVVSMVKYKPKIKARNMTMAAGKVILIFLPFRDICKVVYSLMNLMSTYTSLKFRGKWGYAIAPTHCLMEATWLFMTPYKA